MLLMSDAPTAHTATKMLSTLVAHDLLGARQHSQNNSEKKNHSLLENLSTELR